MIFFYHLTWTVALAAGLPVLLPYLLKSAKRRKTVPFRFGLKVSDTLEPEHRSTEKRPVVWVHALSVGEMNAAVPLIQTLVADESIGAVRVSASTLTGYETALRHFRESGVSVFYFPYDWIVSVRRAFQIARPSAVVLVETDIWPAFLTEAKRRNVPVALVNARLSERSLRGYKRILPFVRPVLRELASVCVQSERDAKRFASLGIDRGRITLTGNVKFDQLATLLTEADLENLRKSLGIGPECRVIVAGSTHGGEEAILRTAMVEIRRRFPNLCLIVAPRDPNRADGVRRLFADTGQTAQNLAAVEANPGNAEPETVVVDRIGVLRSLYAVADVAFVGGSLVPLGGHNPLEPAALGKPVLFGPHMADFRDIAEMLLENGGALRVTDAESISRTVYELVSSPSKSEATGRQAAEVFFGNQGALARTLSVIHGILEIRTGTRSENRKDAAARPSLRQQVETVMADDGTTRGPLANGLAACEMLYRAGVALHSRQFELGLRKPRRLPCPVISVGNITTGGTGKTPMTVRLAMELWRMGLRAAILSRGYGGGAERSGGVVHDGERLLLGPEAAGDEPYLMAKLMEKVPVVVGRDRYAAGMTAWERFRPDLFLLDDGFQHRKLARDIDLALLDGRTPFANGHLLPRGPLREPLAALVRADAIVLTRWAEGPVHPLYSGLPADLRLTLLQKPLFRAAHRPVIHAIVPNGDGPAADVLVERVEATRSKSCKDLNLLHKRGVFAFSGIAKNDTFAETLREAGAELVGHYRVSDHHVYTDAEMAAIFNRARATGAELLATTDKDFVRLPDPPKPPLPLVVIGVEIDFGADEARFLRWLSGRLREIGSRHLRK